MPQDSSGLASAIASPTHYSSRADGGQTALLSLATSVPPIVLRQSDVVARAASLFDGRRSDIDRLLPVFENAGIATRHSCVPLDWYEKPHSWSERNRLYIDNALALLGEAADACLANAACEATEIDAIVTVSTTGIATPSLDAHLVNRLGLRSDVVRLPIFGLGCAGGVLGLARAAALARAMPGARVLFLVVELCALTFRKTDQSKSNIIAAALFGDGAAAALIGPGGSDAGRALAIGKSGEHTWPDSLNVMGWQVEDDGLGVLFSRDIPTLVRDEFCAAADAFLARHDLTRNDIDSFVCHPGGTKVIAALEDALHLRPGTMHEARYVLRRYGNMSAATVLFVLDRHLRGEASPRRVLLSALGPGFTAAFMTLERP
ncbi:MAG: type III polyketide synthase [Alphaproteobacteria bacterium]|nr:type III polyketide synthase [Alphaproteobacteria bacterium]